MVRIDLAAFREREREGLLTCRPHPGGKLVIWNYTVKCQYLHAWDEVTVQARGLITTPEGQIVARPFHKFFNLDQMHKELPLEPFTVTRKMDGSLGILYWLDGQARLATRGSFTSEQAIRANAILQSKYRETAQGLDPAYTYLFEIIYPDNRIVVDYGQLEEIVLLAVIHTETGNELDLHLPEVRQRFTGLFPVVHLYDGIQDIAELLSMEEENSEGFVIRFASGLRVKLKFAEYLRLHRLLTQINARSIWERLQSNQPLDPLLEEVPDEFYAWVQQTHQDFLQQFNAIEEECRQVVVQVQSLPTRKEQARQVLRSRYSGIVFSMLDRKPYAEAIWKHLYPQAVRPFKIDEDG